MPVLSGTLTVPRSVIINSYDVPCASHPATSSHDVRHSLPLLPLGEQGLSLAIDAVSGLLQISTFVIYSLNLPCLIYKSLLRRPEYPHFGRSPPLVGF
jgi:hypothetical protein